MALVLGGTSLAASAAPDNTVRHITIDAAKTVGPMDRFATQSVGSDFPGTLIRPDSQAQLQTVSDELGFRYIRFHDIFHDTLGTVKEVDGQIVYDWTGIDRLYDALLAKNIRPFIELGWTPAVMRTSDLQLFYWKGNTSHPQPDKWRDLVHAFVTHLRDRYGAAEVRRWYFELWNEPNLKDFWENADQEAYFGLYANTARTIKAIDPALRVGGPATAGADWVPEFLSYAQANDLPVDFVATHSYGVDGGFLDEDGKQDTKLSEKPDAIISDVLNVRTQIEASDYPGIPLFFTEWSTSYTPRDFVHDSYISAPYILSRLKATQGAVQGMSYWAYTDLFEEPGPPPTPFHGGFGLMNKDGIRKPAWFTYKYLNALRGDAVEVADQQSFVARDGQNVAAVIWDWQQPEQKVSNKPFFTRLVPTANSRPVKVHFDHLRPGTYHLQVHRTGYRRNDPLSLYIDMGMPEVLDADQMAQMQAETADRPESDRVVSVAQDGTLDLSLPMRRNDVTLVTLAPASD
ncbi:cellulase family glycosylhydrolase [Novosphingobium sp. BW1]|nr:cellulase family glycosylhydrolase [Novosphingobium sp. BW1]TYC92352.1 cellulase family glycosylhydrolase [Novosphingobium sp. BW1]